MVDTVTEFITNHIKRCSCQVLEHSLIFDGPDQCEAISIGEKVPDQTSDAIFLLDSVTRAANFSERVLKVRLLIDLISISVDQLEGEISQYPQETWEVGRHLIRVNGLALSNLQLLRQVDDQGKTLQCIFIDRANAIVEQQ